MSALAEMNVEEYPPKNLERIGRRMLEPGPALGKMMEMLEQREREHFASLGGGEEATGALEQSLTGPGSGAIRHLLPGGELTFGTDIPYAVFQGTSRQPRSPVLLPLPAAQRALATEAVAHYVMHGEAP